MDNIIKNWQKYLNEARIYDFEDYKRKKEMEKRKKEKEQDDSDIELPQFVKRSPEELEQEANEIISWYEEKAADIAQTILNPVRKDAEEIALFYEDDAEEIAAIIMKKLGA